MRNWGRGVGQVCFDEPTEPATDNFLEQSSRPFGKISGDDLSFRRFGEKRGGVESFGDEEWTKGRNGFIYFDDLEASE